MATLPRKLALPLIVTLAIATSACSPEQQGGPPPTPAVTVAVLGAQDVTLTRELPGRTNAWLVAEVRPQVSGLIAERLFTEGERVEKGQPLYQIDDATYRAAANSARAQLARAQATLAAAKLTAERIAELAKIDAVSVQDNDNATAALAQAQADVGVARAALDAANVTLGYARITSPISGRIGRSNVTPGALVTANQPQALATVQQLDPIYVDLTQSSAELLDLRRSLAEGRLSRGEEAMPVKILLEDGSEFPHPGTLKFSEVAVDPSTGSYALRIEVPNPEHVLMPGMYVRAVLGAGVRADAVLVPQRGIARDPKGNTTAMVVDAQGVVEQRQVVVSRTIGDQWLVESGLTAGDRVVVEGLQKIAPGATVEVTETVNAAAADQE
ncbi:MAG TPA: efflux RND transporter periplasmic adaptor subunit [Chiayiivirga sp.]|nr:efflux RND transporter periplasmic adaptor subunit [Chiayiivirga sp.]